MLGEGWKQNLLSSTPRVARGPALGRVVNMVLVQGSREMATLRVREAQESFWRKDGEART